MKILQVISSLAPASGGPSKAVLELSEALILAGHQTELYATDYGLADTHQFLQEIRSNHIPLELFSVKALGKYSYAPSFKKCLQETIREFDVVHIHGLWTYPTWAASVVSNARGIPYVVRPCGMLDQYCFSHHRFRKQIY